MKTYRVRPIQFEQQSQWRWAAITVFGEWLIHEVTDGSWAISGKRYETLDCAKKAVRDMYLSRLLPALEEVDA